MAAFPVSAAAKMAAFPVSAAAKMAALPVSAAAKMAALPVICMSLSILSLPRAHLRSSPYVFGNNHDNIQEQHCPADVP